VRYRCQSRIKASRRSTLLLGLLGALAAVFLAGGLPGGPGRAIAQPPPAGGSDLGSPSASKPDTAAPEDPTLRRAWELKVAAQADLRKGRYRDGVPKAKEALALREQALGPDHPDVADALELVGALLQQTGDLSAARAAYERALKIYEQTSGPQSADTADALGGLAYTRLLQGDAAGARPLGERALRIREDLFGPDSAEVGGSLNGLALVLLDQGDLAGGRAMLERALRIREKALGPNHGLTAQTLTNLGRAFRELGQYDESRAAFERALTIQEKALGPSHPAVAFTLLQLGALHERLDDSAGAKSLYERALKIREDALGANDPSFATVLNDYGNTLRRLGDLQAAGPVIDRALKIREQTLGPTHPAVANTLRNRAFLAWQLRNYPSARTDFERSLKLYEQALGPEHPQVALTLFGLGLVYVQTRDNSAAQATFERAVRIFRNGGFPEQYWRAAWQLGRLYERQGKRAEAAASYREATVRIRELAQSLQQRQSRAQYLDASGRLDVFDALARVLLRLNEQQSGKGYDLEAWAAIEAKKGLVVADALGSAKPKIQDPTVRQAAEAIEVQRREAARLEQALSDERAKEGVEQRVERIQALTTQIARTKGEYLAQVQAFLGRYPQYRAQFVDQQTVDPKALAKFAERLPAEALAVQYFAAPDALYIFVVAPGGKFEVKRQAVAQKDLYDLVRAYRVAVEKGATRRLPWTDDGSEAYRTDVVPLREATERLSGHLLAPIEAELRSHPALILFPNDLLLYLPIHALTWKPQPGDPPRFLAETHVVSYVTQLELTDVLTPIKIVPGEPLLALANPDGSLPAASREVRELVRIRPGVTALDGSEATKARFESLAPKFPELHLATHGVLDPQRPERSYLLMAGDDEASQRLTIADIAGLTLSPHALAILSGCETAVGEQVPGAALVTLAAAFSQAGSQSIVASLWKVSDAATRDFMIAFHRSLGTMGRAAALREAELAVLKQPATMHPYYWAPFVLIGGR
jgi:CHAT domain-containing protein/Tfp pilus assembly protein PilF